ncbi:2OG-Fe(II) oxygenase [Sulfurimonas sp.]|nr:2OG-Fe(II) oxygenase [Sulfurimonas sp.]
MSDFIKVYENTLDDQFCDELIALFENSPHKNIGYTGGGVDTNKKISTDLAMFRHEEYNDILFKLMPQIGDKLVEYIKEHYFMIVSMFSLNVYHPITKKPTLLTVDNFEEVGLPQVHILMQQLFYILPPQLQKYDKDKGNYGYWHSETFPELPNNNALHRVLLYILYLNDVEEGGETEFFYQDVKVKPKKGTLVIAPCYFTHTHRGNIPISDNKYILTSWLQFKEAKTIYK